MNIKDKKFTKDFFGGSFVKDPSLDAQKIPDKKPEKKSDKSKEDQRTVSTLDYLRSDYASKFKSFKHPDLNLTLRQEERQQIIQKFTKSIKDRGSLIKNLESVRDLDIVQTILDVIIDDGFYANPGEPLFKAIYDPNRKNKINKEVGKAEKKVQDKKKKAVEKIVKNNEWRTLEDLQELLVENSLLESPPVEKSLSPKKGDQGIYNKINKEIEHFIERTNLPGLLNHILEDLLFFGEYPLRLYSRKGEGVIQIFDDMDFSKLLGVYHSDKPRFFLHKSKTKFGEKIVTIYPDEVLHFCLKDKKIRIKAYSKNPELSIIPEYIRIGRSIFYSALSKLKQLQLLEMASIANDLRALLSPSILSIGVPASQSPDDVKALTDHYEKYLYNSQSLQNIDPEKITLKDIMSISTQVKILPNYMDGKGQLSNISDIMMRQDNSDMKANQLRNSIAMIIGVPGYYVSLENDMGMSKVETLKVFSRYSRKLISLQESVAETLKNLFAFHIEMKFGYKISTSDIYINFKSIVNVDILDMMEYMVAAVQIVSDIYNALNTVTQDPNLNIKIDQGQFLEFINRILNIFENGKSLLVAMTEEEIAAKAEQGGQGGGGYY